MSTWGSGVFENDQACDLHGTEVVRLVEKVDFVLSLNPVAFDDLEGPLIYIHLLGLLAKAHPTLEIDRNMAERWKAKYLEIFTTTIGPGHEDYVKNRQTVIRREFDTLIAHLPAEEEVGATLPAKAAKKPSLAKKHAPKKAATRKTK